MFQNYVKDALEQTVCDYVMTWMCRATDEDYRQLAQVMAAKHSRMKRIRMKQGMEIVMRNLKVEES